MARIRVDEEDESVQVSFISGNLYRYFFELASIPLDLADMLIFAHKLNCHREYELFEYTNTLVFRF